KNKQYEPSGKASLSKKSDSLKLSEVKFYKNKSNPNLKWIDNGNDTWLEYRDIDETLIIFC
ncbi:13710_t:CDS:1, partial [Funneliformis mosseae]